MVKKIEMLHLMDMAVIGMKELKKKRKLLRP